jgi:hypothetical protein
MAGTIQRKTETMKYELQTIPVWDALRKEGECPICNLMQAAEKDSLDFYTGSSVMNPETRVKVNTTGFCPHHLQLLAESGHPQSLAVMLRSVVQQRIADLEKPFSAICSSKPGRATDKAISAFADSVFEHEQGCLICQRMENRLIRYCYTVAVLWDTDVEFRHVLEESKGFCLHHFVRILEISGKALPARTRAEFIHSMAMLEKKGLLHTADDVEWMTQMYKSENDGKDWNGCEDAHIRAAYRMIGKGRIDDEDNKQV